MDRMISAIIMAQGIILIVYRKDSWQMVGILILALGINFAIYFGCRQALQDHEKEKS